MAKYTAFVVSVDRLTGFNALDHPASLCWWVGEDFANLHMTPYVPPTNGVFEFNATGWDYNSEGPDVRMRRNYLTFELRMRGFGCVARGVMPVQIPFKANVQMAPEGVLSVRISTGNIVYPRNLMVWPDSPIPAGLRYEILLTDPAGNERPVGEVSDKGISITYNGEPQLVLVTTYNGRQFRTFVELWEMAIGHARMFHKPTYILAKDIPASSILGMFWDVQEDLKRGNPTFTPEARFLDDQGKQFILPTFLKVSKKVDDYLVDSHCPADQYTSRL